MPCTKLNSRGCWPNRGSMPTISPLSGRYEGRVWGPHPMSSTRPDACAKALKACASAREPMERLNSGALLYESDPLSCNCSQSFHLDFTTPFGRGNGVILNTSLSDL